MPTAQESVTLTFVFTDVVGSTELLQRLGEERARGVFERHHQQLALAVAEHGGEELEWLGDGMLAAFGSSVQATRCAIAMQRSTRRLVAGQRLAIRIGLHTGEAMRREGGYFGNTLVITRRLCDSADAGQVLTTSFVASMLAGRQFTFREVGTIDLKGIDQPVAVVEVSAGRPRGVAAAEPPTLPADGVPPGRRRRTLAGLLAGGTAVVVVGVVAAAWVLSGSGAPRTTPAVSGHRPEVVQLLPLVLWRDAVSGELAFEPVGWASGTVIDDRGLILTSQAAIDARSYERSFNAIGVAFADAGGNAARPSHLAQVMAVGEGSSKQALLMITADIDGRPTEGTFPAAVPAGDPPTRGQPLQLIGFPAGADVPLRVPQRVRTSDVRDFALDGGKLALVETGALLTAGERGGAAYADDGLIGVLVPAPAAEGTAAITPMSLAAAMIERVSRLLEAPPAAARAAVSFEDVPHQPAGTFEFAVRTTISGMVDGARWSWSCSGPAGEGLGGAWPPVLVWSAGGGAVIDLRCSRWDGFELARGQYTIAVREVAEDGSVTVLAETSITASGPAAPSSSWRARGWPPDFEIDVPDGMGCLTCEAPYGGQGMVVLTLPAETPDGGGQLAVRTYQGTLYAATPPEELATLLDGPGVEILGEPQASTLGGVAAVTIEAMFSENFDGSGPFAGARFLANTRGAWTFASVDGVAFVVSRETFGTPGWEERLAQMEAVLATLRFR